MLSLSRKKYRILISSYGSNEGDLGTDTRNNGCEFKADIAFAPKWLQNKVTITCLQYERLNL